MMKRALAALLALLLPLSTAQAQLGPSTPGPMWGPNWYTGYTPTAYQWQLQWTNKVDYFPGGIPLLYGGTGGTTALQARANLGLGVVSSALNSGQVWVGNSSNVATARTITGSGALSNTGVFSIVDLSSVTNASLANSGLAHAKTTVNGVDCTLGSTCTVTAATSSVPIGTPITSGVNGDLLTVSGGNLAQVLALPAANFPALTGDVITSAGALATTLATVASAGTTGSSTAIPVVTINAKGLTTGITTAAVVAPAGTLTGTTMASNVVTSSLTSVGTLAGLTVTGSFTATGLVTNADLANSSTTVNGTVCTLGSSCSPSSGAAAAGTLTGTTLAANVVTSSLTSVGTLAQTLTVTPSGNSSALTLTGGTVTASAPVLNMTQTWNSGGTVFNGMVFNVTSTASSSSSLIMDLQLAGVSQMKLSRNGGLSITGNFLAGASATIGSTGLFIWSGQSILTSPANGQVLFQNNAQTDFSLMQFGGTTASFPAWKRSGTALIARLADDSANAPLQAASVAAGACTIGTDTLCAQGTSTFTGVATFSQVITANGGVSSAGNVIVGASNSHRWLNTTQIFSGSDGVIELSNNAHNNFSQLQFGGITSSFPSWKRSATAMNARLADDSADTNVIATTATWSNVASDAATTDSSLCLTTSTGVMTKGSGTLGVCLGTSSARYKSDIASVDRGLADVVALHPVSYRYIAGYGDDGAAPKLGFTAEEVVKVIPELVGLDKDGKPNTVDMLGMIPVMANAISELKVANDNLRQELRDLKAAGR